MNSRHIGGYEKSWLWLLFFTGFFTYVGFGEPAVTGEEARAFLGGRSGKIVYVDEFVRRLYYIDLDDSVLTPRKISDDYFCSSPLIHSDGIRVLYETRESIYIRYLEENSENRYPVLESEFKRNISREPHWWTHPITDEEYVTYINGAMSTTHWPPTNGQTLIQKIVNNHPDGEPNELLPFIMAGGRSRNGWWGCTAHHSVGMYRLYPHSVENAFYGLQNWGLMGPGILACNPSISPSAVDSLQYRMMHLHPGLPELHGDSLYNHQGIVIRSWTDPPGGKEPLWYMGIPGHKCNNDSSGNLFWSYPEWSTDESFFTVTGSKEITNWTEADLYIVRINYGGDSKILRIMKGGGKYFFSHMWINPDNRAAKIHLNKGSLNFFSYAQDTSSPAPLEIQVKNSGDGTLPGLSLGELPDWLSVEIEDNGGNKPVLVNSVKREKLDTGSYKASVTVSYGGGADSAVYQVAYHISQPVFTRLRPAANVQIVKTGDSLQLKATALDQAGNKMAEQPEVSWISQDSSKRATGTGWFQAGSEPGAFLMFGKAGSLTCTTKVIGVSWLMRMNAGADSVGNASGWVTDAHYTRTGEKGSLPDSVPAVDLDGNALSGPPSIYRTYRRGELSYSVPEALNGLYTLRLHFIRVPGAPGAQGNTAFDIIIENQKVLAEYEINANSSVSLIDVKEFEISQSDGNGLQIGLEARVGTPVLYGMEAFRVGNVPLIVLSPNGGESFSSGDSLVIRWESDFSLVYDVGIQLLTEKLKIPVTKTRSINRDSDSWGNFSWVVPHSHEGKPFTCDSCRIRVYDYNGSHKDESDSVFVVKEKKVGGIQAKPVYPVYVTGNMEPGKISLRIQGTGMFNIRLVNVQGAAVYAGKVRIDGAGSLDISGLGRGIFILQIRHNGKDWIRRIPAL